MAKPSRNARPDKIVSAVRTFFVTTKSSPGRALFQSERKCGVDDRCAPFLRCRWKFRLHDFVIMPNHVHLLITVGAETTIEKAMQYVNGGFSYRLKKEYGYVGEVWQRGFSEVRVENRESFMQHREYIAANPVEAGLVDSPEKFPYCFSYLAREKAAGAEAPQGLLDRHD